MHQKVKNICMQKCEDVNENLRHVSSHPTTNSMTWSHQKKGTPENTDEPSQLEVLHSRQAPKDT